MGFSDWLLNNKKIERLKVSFYALEIGTIICSLIDKITTIFALTHLGLTEQNPFSNQLMNLIGVFPAIIIGFLASISPMLLIHYGIRRFNWNKESHYWIFSIIMTVYFATFYKLVEHQIKYLWYL